MSHRVQERSDGVWILSSGVGFYPVALGFYPMALDLDNVVLYCNDFDPMAED